MDELNTVLQKIANPEINADEQIKVGKALFRKGDKVMQISNNYDKGVYNGDVGRITQVSKRKYVVQVDFQGVSVEYSGVELEQLKHAFATTVHKVQGGEYPGGYYGNNRISFDDAYKKPVLYRRYPCKGKNDNSRRRRRRTLCDTQYQRH